jgi:hypothetical protein
MVPRLAGTRPGYPLGLVDACRRLDRLLGPARSPPAWKVTRG